MYEKFGKRAFDIAMAIVALTVLSPFIALAALAILTRDGRPVIFLQRRMGQNSQLFTIGKFRTYPRNTPELASADAAALKTTPLGGFLRRSNIDELPQLWNILRGDMSFVGPRPGLPSQTTQQRIREENGAARLKPGLTGLAQIRGRDGMSETEKAINDGEYAQEISFSRDLTILFQTALFVLRRPPVY